MHGTAAAPSLARGSAALFALLCTIFLCWGLQMGVQLDAAQNAMCCTVGIAATRVQCLLACLWPPAPQGCPPALWDPFPIPLGHSDQQSRLQCSRQPLRVASGSQLDFQLLRATAWPCSAASLLGVPLLRPPTCHPFGPGLQLPREPGLAAHCGPSQPSSLCLPHSSSLCVLAFPGPLLGLYGMCAGCGAELGCALPAACPGSPLVAPAPFTSPCSQQLNWLETWA